VCRTAREVGGLPIAHTAKINHGHSSSQCQTDQDRLLPKPINQRPYYGQCVHLMVACSRVFVNRKLVAGRRFLPQSVWTLRGSRRPALAQAALAAHHGAAYVTISPTVNTMNEHTAVSPGEAFGPTVQGTASFSKFMTVLQVIGDDPGKLDIAQLTAKVPFPRALWQAWALKGWSCRTRMAPTH
jgi:hypothetical protein